DNIYSDYLENLLSEEEYIYNKNKYKQKELKLKNDLMQLTKDLNKIDKISSDKNLIDNFFNFDNKEFILSLIDKIVMYDGKIIKINFKFRNIFNNLNSEEVF
ncbi:MAG: hypothetical protein ACLUCH_08560, partial [Lachnospirales bacterium]